MDFSVEMANMASSENKGINQRNENRDGKREKQQHHSPPPQDQGHGKYGWAAK